MPIGDCIDSPSNPTFDEWADYCFTQGYRDFHEYAGSTQDGIADRHEQCTTLSPLTITDYLTTLFRNPVSIAERFTDEQIGEAVWFLFGSGSEYFHDVRSPQVPAALQVDCYLAISTLYTDLFDRICNRRGADPDANLKDTSRLDGAVYMIWDMDCVEVAVIFPESTPHLVDPAFTTLETILARCRTSSCLISALHALGHLLYYYPTRVPPIIDRFLAARPRPPWLHDYAQAAREGGVM